MSEQKPTLWFLETMVTQVCNLSCAACTNHSDLSHSGFVPWSQGQQSLQKWLTRIEIPDFGIIGGEPLVNPEIRDWIKGIRNLMPSSQIRFTTNGILLEKNFDIVDLLHDIGNCVLKISVHVNDPSVEQVIKKIFSRYRWNSIEEHGIKRWVSGSNVRFQVNRPKNFFKSFKGTYSDMLPHASEPAQAFEICCQQTCPLLYKDRIYKCSTSALLRDTLTRFQRLDHQQWDSYLSYRGIAPDTEHETLLDFLSNFGKAENICAMCPSSRDIDSLIDHVSTVTWKSRSRSHA